MSVNTLFAKKLMLKEFLLQKKMFLQILLLMFSLFLGLFLSNGKVKLDSPFFLILISIDSLLFVAVLYTYSIKKKFKEEKKEFLKFSLNDKNKKFAIVIKAEKEEKMDSNIPTLHICHSEGELKEKPLTRYKVKYKVPGKNVAVGILNIEEPLEEFSIIEFYEFDKSHPLLGGKKSGFWVNPKFTKKERII